MNKSGNLKGAHRRLLIFQPIKTFIYKKMDIPALPDILFPNLIMASLKSKI